jgi:hypothetical protein
MISEITLTWPERIEHVWHHQKHVATRHRQVKVMNGQSCDELDCLEQRRPFSTGWKSAAAREIPKAR